MSMGVDASTWLDAEKRQSILSGAQGDSIAEHASAIWHDFDIALIMPEPYYDQRQYWFKIDTYASSDPKYTAGKAFFCEGCRGMQSPEAFRQANFSSRRKRLSSDMHRVRAYCCTQSSELRGQLSAIDRFSKIRPRISCICLRHNFAVQEPE